MNHGRSCVVLGVMLWVLAGCAATPGGEAPPGAADRGLAHGYGLLYELCRKQKNADKVFVFKGASGPTKEAVGRIAAACGDLASLMRARSEAGVLPGLDATGLPRLERDARDRIEARSRDAILWGDAEKPMVLAQLDATRYGAALARSLIERDKGGPIRAELEAFAQTMDEVHEALTGMVVVGE